MRDYHNTSQNLHCSSCVMESELRNNAFCRLIGGGTGGTEDSLRGDKYEGRRLEGSLLGHELGHELGHVEDLKGIFNGVESDRKAETASLITRVTFNSSPGDCSYAPQRAGCTPILPPEITASWLEPIKINCHL